MSTHGLFELHGVDPIAWAARWGLEPFEVHCYSCGALKRTTIPIASRRLRGLACPPCPCGDQHESYLFVAIDGSEVDWSR